MNKAKVSKSAVITAVATAGISALLCAALYIYEYLTDTCLFVFGIMDFHIYLIFGILFEISLAILLIIFIKSKRIKGLLIIAIIFTSNYKLPACAKCNWQRTICLRYITGRKIQNAYKRVQRCFYYRSLFV